MRAAKVLAWTAAWTFYVGVSLASGRGRRSISPFDPLPGLGVAVIVLAVGVLLPLAGVTYAVARRRRIGERLGIVAPGEPSGGGPDEDLGPGRPGGEQG